MNLGLEGYLPYIIYLLSLGASIISVWRPIVGVVYLLPLLPLQTIRYRVNDFPLGASIVGLVLLGVALGLFRTRQLVFPKLSWNRVLCVYAVFTFGSLCWGSLQLQRPLPLPGDPRFGWWQEYMVMPALLLLTAAVSRTKRQIQVMIFLMCFAILLVDISFRNTAAGRDYSTYSDSLREGGGAMGFAGSNGLAAFAAQATTFLLALATFESRLWIRLVYYALAAYSAVCVMYSFSRGGYAALLIGCLVIGVLKQRKILVALIVLVVAWTSIVPPAVRQRVEMTYDSQSGELDNSARTRLSLWDSAMEVFDSNVALGTGFYTYPYMHLNERTDGVSGFYEDTHNFFVRVLVETGLVGMIIFLWLLAMALREGYRLFRQACDKFYASLGLGLVCWLACSAVANCFGDRWTLLQVNGYMWVLAGLVSRAWQLEHSSSASPVRHPIFGTFENPKAAAL